MNKSPNGFRKCKRCFQVKPKAEFSSGKPICNSCKLPSQEKIYSTKAESKKAYYKRHPDKLKEKNEKRNNKRIKKRLSPKDGYKFCSKCKQELPVTEFRKRSDRKYGLNCQCKSCTKKRNYKRTNTSVELEKKSCQKHRRNARKHGLPATFTYEQWINSKNIFNNCCAYCGINEILTQDHFTPLSKRGEYTVNNIIPVCHTCNSDKRDLDFFEWYPQQKFYSKQREQRILEYLHYYNDYQQLAII
jgi:hypothetical protein